VRIDLRRTESLKQGSEIIGSRVKARIVKNKIAAPFRVAEFDIMFNRGISKVGDLLDLGVDRGIVKKSGAFYSLGETRLGQGRENSKEFLIEHPEVAQSIESQLRGHSPVQPLASSNGSSAEGAGLEYSLAGAAELEDSE
jgi:recombination protein RecA